MLTTKVVVLLIIFTLRSALAHHDTTAFNYGSSGAIQQALRLVSSVVVGAVYYWKSPRQCKTTARTAFPQRDYSVWYSPTGWPQKGRQFLMSRAIQKSQYVPAFILHLCHHQDNKKTQQVYGTSGRLWMGPLLSSPCLLMA